MNSYLDASNGKLSEEVSQARAHLFHVFLTNPLFKSSFHLEILTE